MSHHAIHLKFHDFAFDLVSCRKFCAQSNPSIPAGNPRSLFKTWPSFGFFGASVKSAETVQPSCESLRIFIRKVESLPPVNHPEKRAPDDSEPARSCQAVASAIPRLQIAEIHILSIRIKSI